MAAVRDIGREVPDSRDRRIAGGCHFDVGARDEAETPVSRIRRREKLRRFL